MSNIYTNALRLVPTPGQRISRSEADDVIARILRDRGSYNVPVVVRLAADGSLLDIQSGCGKNGAFYEFWEERREDYACMWERFSNDGQERDLLILHRGTEREELGPCRYAFDEVRIKGPKGPQDAQGAQAQGSHGITEVLPDLGCPWQTIGDGVWRARAFGQYLSNNDRTDIERAGPNSREVVWDPSLGDADPGDPAPALATPTSPSTYPWEALRVEPQALRTWVEHGGPWAESVELLHGGRVVHRSQWELDTVLGEWGWEERCADDWDNVTNPEFLSHMRSL
ncbi:hypothetical protein IDM40_03515 [Nocardiopsis sp. HNM0947]|uniref:Uncharacterized protein n=1 Tax=Nocardiopsis coralli TaxID=2772213 RepID=A0ABR9P1Q9_9ACTN|nr:hypothetical protein [Nocardiopsis coralli]MBE2997781.1 hypothetical protein [Nocardiopsis coralli]